jgi:hypothetical protein
MNNARHLRKQNWGVLANTFKEVTGDEDMPTMVEIWKAEAKVEERAEMVLTALRAKFDKVPKGIEDAVLAMTDLIALKIPSGACHTQQYVGRICRSVEVIAEWQNWWH